MLAVVKRAATAVPAHQRSRRPLEGDPAGRQNGDAGPSTAAERQTRVCVVWKVWNLSTSNTRLHSSRPSAPLDCRPARQGNGSVCGASPGTRPLALTRAPPLRITPALRKVRRGETRENTGSRERRRMSKIPSFFRLLFCSSYLTPTHSARDSPKGSKNSLPSRSFPLPILPRSRTST